MPGSIRQKIAARKLSEIIRNPSDNQKYCLGKILREAGYSKETSLKPTLITESKGFKAELERILPDKYLAELTSQLLNSVKLTRQTFNPCISDEEIIKMIEERPGNTVRNIERGKGRTKCYYWSPDTGIIYKTLDIVYRIKGYYKMANQDPPNRINLKIVNYRQ